jgi:hypothetical protein
MCRRYGGSKLIIVHKQPKLLLTTISVAWLAPTWPVWPVVPEVEFNVCAFLIVFSKQHVYVCSFVYANHWFNVVICFYYLWSAQSGIIKTKHWHTFSIVCGTLLILFWIFLRCHISYKRNLGTKHKGCSSNLWIIWASKFSICSQTQNHQIAL